MLITFRLREFVRVVGGGVSFGNGKGGPSVVADHFANENDLSYMIRIMSELPVDGFRNGMSLVAE